MKKCLGQAPDGMNPMITFADNVADTVLAKYDTLPAKRKPTVDGNGVSNWVPLSAIVLTRGKIPYDPTLPFLLHESVLGKVY